MAHKDEVIFYLVVGYFVRVVEIEVTRAHCNHMAELSTHVGTVFYLTKISGVSQCTQKKCRWIFPIYQKTIPYVPISEIDVSSTK